MWDTEMVTLLRFVIDDVDEPVKYTDGRLRQLILVASQFTQSENNFPQVYTISIDNQIIKPDPTNVKVTGIRDDAFINLTILKAACLLARAGLPKANRQHMSVREGPYQFDGRGRIIGEQVIVKTWCEAYGDAQWENSMNYREPGRVIIGPYRSMMERGHPWR